MRLAALAAASVLLFGGAVVLAPPAEAVKLYCIWTKDTWCPGWVCAYDPLTRDYDICFTLCDPCPYPGVAPARIEVLP